MLAVGLPGLAMVVVGEQANHNSHPNKPYINLGQSCLLQGLPQKFYYAIRLCRRALGWTAGWRCHESRFIMLTE